MFKHFCAVVILFFACVLTSPVYSQGRWTLASSEGFTPRTYACAAVVNNKIYVIGGFPSAVTPGAVNTVEVYDPASDTWTTPETTGSFAARGGCTATVVNDKIYVIGGYDENWTAVNTVSVFDPATSTWTNPTVGGTATARHRHSAAFVNGKIYVIGGMTQSSYTVPMEAFDPATNMWSTVTTSGTFTPRRAAGSALIEGRIYLHGGYNGSKALNVLEVFDPATNVWSTPNADLTSSARYAGAAVVINNVMYHVGGFNLVQMVNQIETFEPSTGEWNIETENGDFTGRSGIVAAYVNGKIYVIGGSTLTGLAPLNEVYTPDIADVADENADVLRLSPNPSTGDVSLSGIPESSTGIELYNELGQMLLQEHNISHMSVIRSAELRPGVYTLRCRIPGRDIVRTLVRF